MSVQLSGQTDLSIFTAQLPGLLVTYFCPFIALTLGDRAQSTEPTSTRHIQPPGNDEDARRRSSGCGGTVTFGTDALSDGPCVGCEQCWTGHRDERPTVDQEAEGSSKTLTKDKKTNLKHGPFRQVITGRFSCPRLFRRHLSRRPWG
jgi:hypothetical protein